jgi:hypothetical protein
VTVASQDKAKARNKDTKERASKAKNKKEFSKQREAESLIESYYTDITTSRLWLTRADLRTTKRNR